LQSSSSRLWWTETSKTRSMFRSSFTFIVIALLVGCTGTPTQRSAPTEPILRNATNELSTASPNIEPDENTIPPAKPATIQEYPVPAGSHPHDVAPAPDGTVWYTSQLSGELGRLDPATGVTHHIPLGPGSSPHGVIVGPDGAPWITDSGLNAIARVDPGGLLRVGPESAGADPGPACYGHGGPATVTDALVVLGRIAEATAGHSIPANLALAESNARVAAEIAVAVSTWTARS